MKQNMYNNLLCFSCNLDVSYTMKKNPTKVYIDNKLLITFCQEFSLEDQNIFSKGVRQN